MQWTFADMPSQEGRVAVVTGANSGIGLEAARGLAGRGATVVLACRTEQKAAQAANDIRRDFPDARLEYHELELSSQKHIRKSAAALGERHQRIDLLINNAGVMWLEEGLTEDGFEQQFGINHLGHFTWTGLLLDRIRDVPDARIVTVSSLAHRSGKIHFDNPALHNSYNRHKAYAQSKLANLMFAIELNRRLERAGAEAVSVACHPGAANTRLAVPGIARQSPLGIGWLARALWPLLTQSAQKGALPTLYAATAREVTPGGYYGPDGWFEAMGYPAPAYARRYARDPALGARLWELSERLTGVQYGLG